jgi:hypothetical protein
MAHVDLGSWGILPRIAPVRPHGGLAPKAACALFSKPTVPALKVLRRGGRVGPGGGGGHVHVQMAGAAGLLFVIFGKMLLLLGTRSL